ncbi:T-cell activation inhibitor, mitochondrial-like isoform X1 [Lycorma delicatula]|uniref:T-cell activation inhibitor, mitochondrial-like isoform X1 n=1 Tax=Lycorma delicatula TaxID=130591 RepID=UPI003F5146FB
MASEIFCSPMRYWFKHDKRIQGCLVNVCRYLTSGEVSTALRPFYFNVHPDLFGQFPSERAVNENSLQILSSFLENIQQNRYIRPTTVKFYLKPQKSVTGKVYLKSVNIQLSQSDVRKTVVSILSSCNLPTTYVDSITPTQPPAPKSKPDFRTKVRQQYSDYNYNTQSNIKEKIKKSKENESLRGWLESNVSSAREKTKACAPILEEIKRLQEGLCQSLGLKAVVWDCGWNVAHFRGSLQSFQALAEHHADLMHHLKGRTLVFANDTGVSLDGRVLLNSAEVRHNWLDFIKNIWKDDIVLGTVPAFEKAVSRVLRDIKVVRRKFQPVTMAKHYENNLRRLTTTLSDYQGRRGYPKTWPVSLKDYELVVETEAGPLMVSPTGQFIVPASCPSFLLVNFITEHLGQASEFLQQYKTNKDVENELLRRCVTELKLAALSKDDCITPNLMIQCCQQLLAKKDELGIQLQGAYLYITNYYSVMSDGQICIPWNFKM